MQKKKLCKMTFSVTVPVDFMIDEESLQEEFNGNIEAVARFLSKEEGNWWDEEMIFEKAEIIEG